MVGWRERPRAEPHIDVASAKARMRRVASHARKRSIANRAEGGVRLLAPAISVLASRIRLGERSVQLRREVMPSLV
jgi:hypothetical protein